MQQAIHEAYDKGEKINLTPRSFGKTNKTVFAIVTKGKGGYVVMNEGKTYNNVWDAMQDCKDMNHVTNTVSYQVVQFNVRE